jgi:hypothetical protein
MLKQIADEESEKMKVGIRSTTATIDCSGSGDCTICECTGSSRGRGNANSQPNSMDCRPTRVCQDLHRTTAQIQVELQQLTKRLAAINESLARKVCGVRRVRQGVIL